MPADTGEPGKVHYLSHRAVIRQDKESTKVRSVFDESSKSSGPSLNECLYAGPNLLTKIFDILLRFRTKRIALVSDMKQAFLYIAVHEDHANYLRSLWVNHKDSEEIVIYRFLWVVFGVTSSPFLLQGTVRYHCEKMVENGLIEADFVEEFLKNLYVDDCLNGADTVANGFEFYKKGTGLMDSAGFSLRKWCSNNNQLQQMIDVEDGVINTKLVVESNGVDELSFANFLFGVERNVTKSVLGVQRDLASDELTFDFSEIIGMGESIKLTKRNILKVSSSFYDPLGIISPITVQAKIIFQLLCKERLDWDSELPKTL